MARALRYNFIVGLVALSAALAAAGGWKYARASAPVSGPVVLISIDGLRADRLSAYGYRDASTPAIDRLATDGVLFERAYSHVPQSLPAHAAILTGRLPFDNGIRDAVGFRLGDSDRLLPEILRDRGYVTAGVVSTFELASRFGTSRGFQFFDDTMAPAGDTAPLGGITRDNGASEESAEHWLQSAGTDRAFLFLQLHVHTPGGDRPYDEEVAGVDEAIGRFVRYLKTHQLYDQSTIVLVGAYGDGLGDHLEERNGLLVYEEALRVPLIVKQAAGEDAGVRVSDVVQHVDLMPTLLDFAKAPVPGNVQGRSLKPLLDGATHFPARTAYSESLYGYYHFGFAPLRTLTDGTSRYIDAPVEELFDLKSDPRGQHNVAADPAHARALKELKAQLAKLVAGHTLPAAAELASADRDRFSVIGFVGDQRAQPDIGPTEAVDPKDKVATVRAYRTAVSMAFSRRWAEGIQGLTAILRSEPKRVDLWDDLAGFALRANRIDLATDAYRHIAMLRPGDDRISRRVRQVKAFADARTMFNQRRYKAALPMFEDAIAQAGSDAPPIVDLHYYAAETLARLDRPEDAQAELLKELQDFPDNAKARAEFARLAPSER